METLTDLTPEALANDPQPRISTRKSGPETVPNESQDMPGCICPALKVSLLEQRNDLVKLKIVIPNHTKRESKSQNKQALGDCGESGLIYTKVSMHLLSPSTNYVNEILIDPWYAILRSGRHNSAKLFLAVNLHGLPIRPLNQNQADLESFHEQRKGELSRTLESISKARDYADIDNYPAIKIIISTVTTDGCVPKYTLPWLEELGVCCSHANELGALNQAEHVKRGKIG